MSAYIGDDSETLPATPDPAAYYSKFNAHGGKGLKIAEATDASWILIGDVPGYTPNALEIGRTITLDANRLAPGGLCVFTADRLMSSGALTEYRIYNEQGELLDSVEFSYAGLDSGDAFVIAYSAGTYRWIEVAPMLSRFAGINNLLLTILPVVSIAGFLGISGAKLYSYGKGTASIGSSISTSVFTLIGIVVAMVIAGPILGAAVDANQVVVSGQYQVNTTFGNIIQLLFAMIPVVYIAGLVTLVGLQARSALMGGQGGGGNMG